MTASPTAAPESTPRRRFLGWAGLVVRAVSAVAGTVGAACHAVRAVGQALAKEKAPPPRRRRPASRLVAPAPRRALPGWLRRLIQEINDERHIELRPLLTLGQACRRFYLGTAAAPFVSLHEIGRATRSERPVSVEARWADLLAERIAKNAIDRQRPPMARLGYAIGRSARVATVMAASVSLPAAWVPTRPT